MMKQYGFSWSAALMAVGVGALAWAGPEAVQNVQKPALSGGPPVVFGFGGEGNQEFMLNGKPFQIRGAEMHPQRIPREYWRHRIRTAKAMGLNTIAFYVFWNDHEQPDGSFDFKTGNRDLEGFLKLCQEEGMWVLFRPGPYACGEWDLGGLPHYLLKDPKAKLRTTEDAKFMKAQTRYLEAVARVAEPFLAKNGGPILMTQLENEYGSYQRKDRKYMEWLKAFWSKKGFGPFYTSDGAGEHFLKGVVLPGVAVGLDPGLNDGHWAVANKCNPGVPVFSSETYPGWLRHWGEGNWAPTPGVVNHVRWFMDKGRSFSLFVFHGGTNFGFSAGANNGGPGKYQPDLTSYDYGSPVDEQGRMNEYYAQMREIILKSCLPKPLCRNLPRTFRPWKFRSSRPQCMPAFGRTCPSLSGPSSRSLPILNNGTRTRVLPFTARPFRQDRLKRWNLPMSMTMPRCIWMESWSARWIGGWGRRA